MNGKGTVILGGHLGAGGVGADITLDDGSRWTFAGGVGGLDEGVDGSPWVSGDFPGESHMAGGCFLQIAGGSAGPGYIELLWSDLHGRIGTVTGETGGFAIQLAIGGGTWTRA